jgi:hypothetical protein
LLSQLALGQDYFFQILFAFTHPFSLHMHAAQEISLFILH